MSTHATSTRWETSDVPRHVWLRPELQNEVTPEVTPELVGSPFTHYNTARQY